MFEDQNINTNTMGSNSSKWPLKLYKDCMRISQNLMLIHLCFCYFKFTKKLTIFIICFYGMITLCSPLVFWVTISAKFLFSLHIRNYHFLVRNVPNQITIIFTLGFKPPSGLSVFFEGFPLNRTYRSAFMISTISPAFVSQSSVFSVAIWTPPNDFSPSALYFLRLFPNPMLIPPLSHMPVFFFLSCFFSFFFFFYQSNFHYDLEYVMMLFSCPGLGLFLF